MALVTAFPCLARNCGVRQRVSALPLMQTHGGPFLSWPTTGLDAQQTLMEHSLILFPLHCNMPAVWLQEGLKGLVCSQTLQWLHLNQQSAINTHSVDLLPCPHVLESLTTALQCYPKEHSNLFQRTTRHRLFSLDLQKIFSVPWRLVSWGGCNGEKSSFHKSDFSQEIIFGNFSWRMELDCWN